jgi:hypothetical protein
MTSTSILVSPKFDTSDTAAWSLPVIIGVILTTFAIVVGLPSAVLAFQEIRKRRRATQDGNEESIHTKSIEDEPKSIGSVPSRDGSDLVYRDTNVGPLHRPNISKDVDAQQGQYASRDFRQHAHFTFTMIPRRTLALERTHRNRKRSRRGYAIRWTVLNQVAGVLS